MEIEFKATDADLTILEHIEDEPDTTQAGLAEKLGVAVGTVNWHLKRLVEKGYVKVKRAERKKITLYHHAGRPRVARAPDSGLHSVVPGAISPGAHAFTKSDCGCQSHGLHHGQR